MNQLFNHQQDDIFNKLIQWAEQHERVRAMLLTSTRAVPNARVDFLSDYDVILIVEDIHPFYEDRSWLEDFGEVLVVYWDPIYPDPEHGIQKTANVTQYADGLKIDFTLWPVALFQKIVRAPVLQAELDAGYRVLLDKDNLTREMKPPTHQAYIPTRPTNEAYQLLINDFFTDVPYMGKCLLRGELLPAKWCLDYDMKHIHLRPMLEWRAEVEHNWSVPTGSLGKGLKKLLPPATWSRLEDTYAGAGTRENWEALFRTITLFREVAIEVGEALGYEYPLELDQRVTAFVQRMQEMSYVMDFDTQVKLAIYNHFAATGRAPSPDEAAKSVGVTVENVLESYQRLRAQRLLVLEPDESSIRMAPPFSGVPTQHVVEADGIRYFANCAWDALGIPAALQKAATVHSRCAQSAAPFDLYVDLRGPEQSDWLFHCLVPAAKWWEDIVFT